MNKRKSIIFSILSVLVIIAVFFSGCEEVNNGDTDVKIFVENSYYDGFIAREESQVQGIIVSEDNMPMKVGLFSSTDYSSDELNYLSRGILRFDISDWDNTDITFWIKCINVQGTPAPLEEYFMDDPEALPNFDQLQDITSIWSLTDSSVKFMGEAYPIENQWVNITLEKTQVKLIIDEKYSRNEYMTIMLKLFFDFTLDEYGNYFELATVDYTPNDDSDQPYIEFN